MPEAPLSQEQRDLITEIHTAFANISRGTEGTSWSEAVAHDNYESDAICLAARESDKDTSWTQLVDDERWHPFPGIGGFSFVNVEGFRYYLPPTLVLFIRLENEEWFPGHLLGVIERFIDQESKPVFSAHQMRTIARCIEFLSRNDQEALWCVEHGEPNPWDDALNARWRVFL